LKTFPAQHYLFQTLLERSKLTEGQDTEPTDEEIDFASSAWHYGKNEEVAYLKRLRKLSHSGSTATTLLFSPGSQFKGPNIT
jgi:hypothetical protein